MNKKFVIYPSIVLYPAPTSLSPLPAYIGAPLFTSGNDPRKALLIFVHHVFSVRRNHRNAQDMRDAGRIVGVEIRN